MKKFKTFHLICPECHREKVIEDKVLKDRDKICWQCVLDTGIKREMKVVL